MIQSDEVGSQDAKFAPAYPKNSDMTAKPPRQARSELRERRKEKLQMTVGNCLQYSVLRARGRESRRLEREARDDVMQ